MVSSATPPVVVLMTLAVLLLLVACGPRGAGGDAAGGGAGRPGAAVHAARVEERAAMVSRQLAGRDITDPRVLAAMQAIPRHEFVPPEIADAAYQDSPLPIGLGQTISQPYIVALMTQLGQAGPESRALDVGTGSGYQAAVLAEVAGRVYSIEILCDLAREAEARLARLGYRNVEVRCGDGYRGLAGSGPFRRHHRGGRAGGDPPAPDRSARPRRPARDPGRGGSPGADRGRARPGRDDLPLLGGRGALRADDGRGPETVIASGLG